MKAVLNKTLDWNDYDRKLGKQIQTLGQKKGQLSKSKSKAKNKDEIEKLSKDIKLLQKYRTRLQLLDEGSSLISPTTGKGIRKYKQPKRNAYKIDAPTGQYGGLLINVPRLLNEMVVEAITANGGTPEVVYETQADKSLVDLLTKKFNPKKKYSSRAIQIFNDLNRLSGMPEHKSSGKSKLTVNGGSIFTSPEELLERLTLLTGTRRAGNNNLQIRNEIWEIIDKLLKLEIISKKDYDEYVQKFLT